MGQYTSYWLYQKYEQRGSQEPIPVYPNAYSINGDGTMTPVVRNEDDPQCGYIPPVEPTYRWTNIPITQDYICDECGTTQYRWVNLDPSVDYYCEGTTKYYKQKRQVSFDGGVTWQDVIPYEYQMGGVAEEQSTDCSGYENQYFTIVPYSAARLGLVGDNAVAHYSIDGGRTWNEIAIKNPITDSDLSAVIPSGSRVMISANVTYSVSLGVYGTDISAGYVKYDIEGNAMSLMYGDDFADKFDFPYAEPRYYSRIFDFLNSEAVVNAENVILPVTALTDNCYASMFNGCTNLKTSPKVLPATTLAPYCYNNMFQGCTSLTTVPEIKATTVASHSCFAMFYGCSGLTTPMDTLPATQLADNCYGSMFNGCTSLQTAPELPATTLAENCYANMFYGCTSLTTAPELPSTTLANECYMHMFNGCKSLVSAPLLPATRLVSRCYEYMFSGCTRLNEIICLATNISATRCTYDWVSGVSRTGTFYKNPSMSSWTRGTSGVPGNWTIIDYTG